MSALLPTWVPEGLVLRSIAELLPGDRHTYERKTFYRSPDGLRCFELTLHHPAQPIAQVFAESIVLLGGTSGIITRFAEFICLEHQIGDVQVSVTGRGLTVEDLVAFSSSVQIRFDKFGPHLTSVATGNLVEQHFDKPEHRLLLNYTSQDYRRSLSLSTEDEPNISTDEGIRFERNGVRWQLHLHNVVDSEVTRFIDGLRSATMDEFHEARKRAEPLTDPGEEPWTRLGFLSGDERLLNNIELQMRPAQNAIRGIPDNGSHEVLVSYRGTRSGFHATPSATPPVNQALYQRGIHLGIVLAEAPIIRAHTLCDGQAKAVCTFSYRPPGNDDAVQVFAIFRRDDEPPFQQVDFLDQDGLVVHSVRDLSP
jgi:hypothetical protein